MAPIIRSGTHAGIDWELRFNYFIGTVNGYIRVPKDHPWFGQGDLEADVHGGVT